MAFYFWIGGFFFSNQVILFSSPFTCDVATLPLTCLLRAPTFLLRPPTFLLRARSKKVGARSKTVGARSKQAMASLGIKGTSNLRNWVARDRKNTE